MKISYLELRHAEQLTRLYNSQITGIPHCYPVTPEEFSHELGHPKKTSDNELYADKIIVGEERWGRYLLHRTLWEMQQRGYTHTVTSSSWRNPLAMLLYSNFGFSVTDTVFGFTKEM